MSLDFKNFLKTWVPAITLLVAIFVQSGKIITGLSEYAKELHGNTLAIAQLDKKVSEMKQDVSADNKESKLHEQRQTDDIERLNVDVARLKVLARIATIEHDNLPVTDHCSIYRDALVALADERRMSLN